MDFPIFDGAFEVRARGSGRVLSGRFPYNRTATVRSSGRNRKERFKSGSLRWQVREFDKVQAELGAMVKDTAAEVRERWKMSSSAVTRLCWSAILTTGR